MSLGKWSTPTDVLASMRLTAPSQLARLAGSSAIVTGANTGIGKETARALRDAGAHVIFACRSVEKAEAAMAETGSERGSSAAGSATALPLDLSDLASVKAFADTFLARSVAENWAPLTCMVLNAGLIGLGGVALSAQNHEMTFAVNHLGHWLLTRLLLPTLRAASPARVVVVASNSSFGPLVTDDLVDESVWMRDVVNPAPEDRGSTHMAAKMYGTSKLANILFAQELHRNETSRGTGVVCVSLHPGSLILTDIARQSWLASFLHRYVASWWTKSAKQGAATTVFGCTMPQDEIVGQYLEDCKARRPPRLSTPDAARVLEVLSAKLCRSFL